MNVGVSSYLFAFFAYLILTILISISWRGRPQGILIILAAVCSTVWAGAIAAGEFGARVSFEMIQLAELSRNLSWCLFLLDVLCKKDGESTRGALVFRFSLGCSAVLILFGVLFSTPFASEYLSVSETLFREIVLVLWVVLSLTGLILIEQIFRNSGATQRWSTKFLCLGIGSFFVYDFFMYSDALLFKRISLDLWEARGLVNGMAAPLIVIAIARNPKFEMNIHVSRHVVFHTATIMGAGVYLLLMATAGYFIRYYGGTWGSVLQIVFFFGAVVLLVTLMFSDKIRAQVRVLLSKHFFSYKHDYREEWLKFTQTLSGSDDSVPERVIQSIAKLTESPGGILWEKNDAGHFSVLARWHMPEPDCADAKSLDSLTLFMTRTHWVVDIDEYNEDPEKYTGLVLPDWLLKIRNIWLLVPLILRDECLGFVLVRRSDLYHAINWEDRDLLKMAGQHAASHLAQYRADQALIRSRQFEAFNRLSAYIVHDLKNILAQQSLIITNAEKHKHKPEFIDDVLATVKNSVNRMTRLMEQMRSGVRGDLAEDIELGSLLTKLVRAASAREPKPVLESVASDAVVRADREQLSTVFGHIIQNAQDATPATARVAVSVEKQGQTVHVIIEDAGTGMDRAFIRDRLFSPFDSTKGLTGMGVGAFESREYIRAVGGDILVASEPGVGSQFTIILPCSPIDGGEASTENEGSQS